MILAAAASLVLALISTSAGALGVPAAKVPSLTVPSVSTPVATTPSVTTPSVSIPPVSAPPVKTPSISVPSVGAGPSSRVNTPAVRVPSVSVSGGSTSSTSPSSSASSAAPVASSTAGSSSSAPASSSRGFAAGARRSATHSGSGHGAARQTDARRERQLRSLVKRLNGCLASLPAQDQRVLELRTGIDTHHAYSSRQVARRLHLNPGREARVEHTAVTDLRRSAATGCASQHSLTMLQVPPEDRLVAVSPALAGTGAAVPVNLTTPGQSASGTPQRQSVKDASAVRNPRSAPAPAIEAAAFAELPGSNGTGTVLVLLAISLLAVLAFLSAMGRRLMAQQRGATAGPAVFAVSSAPASAGPMAAAPFAVAAAAVAPEPVAEEDAPSVRDESPGAALLVERGTPAESPVPAPVASPALPAATAPVPPPVRAPVPPPVRPVASTPSATPSPGAGPAAPSSQEWLRTHRSQIALVLTAAAGGAIRAMARGRRRR